MQKSAKISHNYAGMRVIFPTKKVPSVCLCVEGQKKVLKVMTFSLPITLRTQSGGPLSNYRESRVWLDNK
jgi:hypothetical protein